ncbi:MAG: hydrogenase maturation nickel metallochaperone HypA [Myxococcales bacterium]|nr:hydrogenase maturation nickel metallochaperone HypA [Myxococcales bacterium]
MHEYSIVSALVDQVAVAARAHPTGTVKRVHVAIGELAGVELELLATAFETFRDHTVCAQADLVIEPRPACWRCPRCQVELARGAVLRCGACQVPARLVTGDEIILQRVELDLGDDDQGGT